MKAIHLLSALGSLLCPVIVNPPSEAAMDVKIKQLAGEPDQYMVYLITTAEPNKGNTTSCRPVRYEIKTKEL